MHTVKAIVLEVPNRCILCSGLRERHEFGEDLYNCRLVDNNSVLNPFSNKPSWCPLEEEK